MSETLREAIERLAEEATQRAFPDIALIDDLRAALAEHPATPAEEAGEEAAGEREALEVLLYEHREDALTCYDHGGYCCICGAHNLLGYRTHLAEIVAALTAKARAEALRLVREVEADMSEQAFKAWRAADARKGLADHDALLAHADALTRWSERFRMAFDGDDYRADSEASA